MSAGLPRDPAAAAPTPRGRAAAWGILAVGLTVGLPGTGCSKGRALPELATAELGLPAPPEGVARLERSGPVRTYAGPARLERVSQEPLHLRLEDLALAEPLEIVVERRSPVTFGRPGGQLADDAGTLLEDGGKLLLSIERTWLDGSPHAGAVEQLVVVGRIDPEPIAPPRDWLQPGTTLFYGLTLDDKPMTRVVPMGLMVVVEEADDGGRRLRWQADVDPDMQVYDTTARYLRGVAVIPADVADAGTVHDDGFALDRQVHPDDAAGAEEVVDHTSLFLSRQARRTLSSMGAAAMTDADVDESALLTAWGRVTVPLQADDALWSVPATVARYGDGRGTFVVADDATDPLILSAKRPGSHLRLLAIGRPAR